MAFRHPYPYPELCLTRRQIRALLRDLKDRQQQNPRPDLTLTFKESCFLHLGKKQEGKHLPFFPLAVPLYPGNLPAQERDNEC